LQLDETDIKITRVDSQKLAVPGEVINFTINFRNSGTITIADNAYVSVSESTTGTTTDGHMPNAVTPGEYATYDQSFMITGEYEVITFYPSMLIKFFNETYGGWLTINITPEYPTFNISGPSFVDKYSSTVFNLTAMNLEGDLISTDNTNITLYQILEDDVISAVKATLGTLVQQGTWLFRPEDYNLDCGAYVIAAEGSWDGVVGDAGSRVVITGCVI
jgi:hypothetical protein